MKRFIFSLALFLSALCVGLAQDDVRNKMLTVFFDDLEYNGKSLGEKMTDAVHQAEMGRGFHMGHNTAYVKEINQTVVSALGETNRMRLASFDEDFRMTGSISDISFERRDRVEESKDKQGNVKKEKFVDHFCRITITLLITNVKTTQEWKETISAQTGWNERNRSENDAFYQLLPFLRGRIVRYLNNAFPIQANVIEGGKVKKDKMQQLYIDYGFAEQAQPRMTFRVDVTGEIAGRKTHEKIGEVEIVEILGDSISLCKVTRGAKEIKTAFDEGQELTVKSIN